jgi:ribosomal protein S27E
MKKIECPSCAMEIAENSAQCPICGYEFAQSRGGSGWVKWVAVLLLLIILFYWIF